MKIKITELDGVALNWVVGKCEKLKTIRNHRAWLIESGRAEEAEQVDREALCVINDDGTVAPCPNYLNNWEFAGELIDRERIGLWWSESTRSFNATKSTWVGHVGGHTPIIAILRCYVLNVAISKGEIDVPDEIVRSQLFAAG